MARVFARGYGYEFDLGVALGPHRFLTLAFGTASDADFPRRLFLQLAAAPLASGAEPCLGLISPRPMPVPPEAFALYPAGIRFVTATIDPGLTLPEDFDQLTSHIVPAAAKLRDSGAKAIMMMAPSLSSYRGADFNEKVSTAVVSATGLPSITASTAIIRGLKTVSARRIAVATAYTDEINLRLQGFLNEKGFEILVLEGSGTDRFEKSAPVAEALTPAEAMQFAVKVREDRPGADTLLLGFGPLATHDLIVPLEKPCRIPVVSASLHALSFGIRLLGIDAKIHGLGTLLEKI